MSVYSPLIGSCQSWIFEEGADRLARGKNEHVHNVLEELPPHAENESRNWGANIREGMKNPTDQVLVRR